MKPGRGDLAMLRYLVGRLHVGTSLDGVWAELKMDKRLNKAKVPAGDRRLYRRAVRAVLLEGRDLYNNVMSAYRYRRPRGAEMDGCL